MEIVAQKTTIMVNKTKKITHNNSKIYIVPIPQCKIVITKKFTIKEEIDTKL